MPTLNSLQELFLQQIQALYDAEKQLLDALPKFADAARDAELKQLILEHFDQTKDHMSRLEQIFETLGAPVGERACKAMRGLVAEGTEAIELDCHNAVRDAAIIGASRRIEHYEIAAYTVAISMADQLGEPEVIDLLQETLEDETFADQSLSAIAQGVNEEAFAAEATLNGSTQENK